MPNNYTITEVTYTNITAGANVAAAHANAILTLTPDDGFTLTAANFSTSSLPSGITSTVFTQSGINVICTATFSNSLVMPSNNLELPLCINGQGILKQFHVTGRIDPHTPFLHFTVNPSALRNFDVSGDYESIVSIYNVVVSATNGYYFPVTPTLSQIAGDRPLFSLNTTKQFDAQGHLIQCTIAVSCTIPNRDSFNNNFLLNASAYEIYVPVVKITNYIIDTSVVSVLGDIRILTLVGGEGANWTLQSSSPIMQTADINPITHQYILVDTISGTIDSSGTINIPIILPAQSVSAEYTIMLSGDVVDPFPSPLPIILEQLAEVNLNFSLAAGPRFTVTPPVISSHRTYSALAYPPTNVGVAEVVSQWTITSNDGGKLVAARELNIDDITVWPTINQTVSLEVDDSIYVLLYSVEGLEVGMDLIDPLIYINNAITAIDITNNEVTLTRAISLPVDTVIGFSYNKGNNVGFSNLSTSQITPNQLKITENALISQFGYGNANYVLSVPIRRVITSYEIDTSTFLVPPGGGSVYRDYIVYGDPGAVFSITLFNGVEALLIVEDMVMTPAGMITIEIDFNLPPKVIWNEWVITIFGDLSPTFDTPQGLPSAVSILEIEPVSIVMKTFGQRLVHPSDVEFSISGFPYSEISTGDPRHITHCTFVVRSGLPPYFPLQILRQPTINDISIPPTYTTNIIEAVNNSTELHVENVFGLEEGQFVITEELTNLPYGVVIVSVDAVTRIVSISFPITLDAGSEIKFSKLSGFDVSFDNFSATQSGNDIIVELDMIVYKIGLVSTNGIVGIEYNGPLLNTNNFIVENPGCSPNYATYRFENSPLYWPNNEDVMIITRNFDNTLTYTNTHSGDTVYLDSVGFPLFAEFYPISSEAFPTFEACATP